MILLSSTVRLLPTQPFSIRQWSLCGYESETFIVIAQMKTMKFSLETLKDSDIPHPQSSPAAVGRHHQANSSSLVFPLESGAVEHDQKSPGEASGWLCKNAHHWSIGFIHCPPLVVAQLRSPTVSWKLLDVCFVARLEYFLLWGGLSSCHDNGKLTL